jgi:hypothetical protein
MNLKVQHFKIGLNKKKNDQNINLLIIRKHGTAAEV